jgi:hypothetical protein
MAGRERRRESGNSGRKRQRQEELIGKVALYCGFGGMMFTESRHRLVSHSLGRLAQPAIGGEGRG